MIYNITFPEDGKGYIYSKPEEPVKPTKQNTYGFRTRGKAAELAEEAYKEAQKEYRKDLKFYKEHKDEFACPCAKNLIGRTFGFMDKKVNILFGPNGSGKTTILKALAGEALCTDGFTTLLEPTRFGWGDEEYDVADKVRQVKINSCKVDWDGAPIYYHNFEDTLKRNFNQMGGYVGSVVASNFAEEALYRMDSGKVSAGQHALYILGRLLLNAAKKRSLESLIGKGFGPRVNSVWAKCAKAQLEYFASFPKYSEEEPPTLLFDEIDKSLDINATLHLYEEFFPKLIEKCGNQIILVSHNPLVLSENIYDSPAYNVISLDPEYTKEVKTKLRQLTF
jgi:hypothetical protein